MPDFVEIADRVWVARYPWCDVNITLIGGQRGLLVVDTHGSSAAGAAVADDVRRLGAGPVVGIVNTHWHFDHTFGNHAFRRLYDDVPIHAHETAAAELAEHGPVVLKAAAERPTEPHDDEVAATELVIPDHLFSSTAIIDLDDRAVELVHPGRGHTAGDLVVVVPDADVLLTGDLIEESAAPSIGEDSWPLDWPLTLDLVLDLMRPTTTVVPGHGASVDPAFVVAQRGHFGVLAETIKDLAGRGVPVAEAPQIAEWPDDFPWTLDEVAVACRLGYAHLPRQARRLPLA